MDVKVLSNLRFLFNKRECNLNINVGTVFHVVSLCFHSTVLMGFVKLDLDVCKDPFVETVKPYRFFTISGWCFALQLVHLWVSLQIEWMQFRGYADDQLKQKKNFKDYLFRSFVMPSTLLVCILFWSLWFIDRNLVYPPAWDQLVPYWMNHGVHSVTAAVTCLELMMHRTSGIGRKMEVLSYWCFSGGYAVLMWLINMKDGVWIYPFLGLFSWYQYIIFQFLFCLSGHLLMNLVWNLDERRMMAEEKSQ